MKEKNTKRYIVVIIIILLLSVVGFTSAYVLGGFGVKSESSVDVSIDGTVFLHFDQTGHINIDVTPSNFYDQGGNIVDEVIASAELKGSELIPKSYYVTLVIKDNEFIYTTEDEKAELILNLYDKEGEEITEIEGLDYVNSNGVSGFDVTTVTGGKYILFEEVSIEIPSGETTIAHEYKVKLTMVNLDTLQDENTGKIFEAQLVLTETKLDYVENFILENYNTTYEDLLLVSNPTFSNATTASDKGIYTYNDAYTTSTGKKSIYFRGAVDDNWLKFGQENGKDIYWRIVRINGDNTIKILYSGTTAPTSTQGVTMTGIGTSINGGQTSAFNSVGNSAEYLGYMYTVGSARGTKNDSTIKTVIDNWYEENLVSYKDYISYNTSLCYDRTSYTDTAGTTSGSSVGTTTFYFKSRVNNEYRQTPDLTCNNVADYYTVQGADNGNNALTYPVGLLTTDEATLAGVIYGGTTGSSNYLYTKTNYWLGSPYFSNSYGSYSQRLVNGVVSGTYSTEALYVRTVISLGSNVLVTGSGTWDNPFVVLY